MKADTLGEVIEAEKKIRARLDEERRKAGRYVDEVRKQTARDAVETEGRLAESLDRAVREAEADAREKADSIRREARERAELLRGLDDVALRPLVPKHIASILPEAP